MAKYFYEGNLNEQENYHKKGQIEYYIRGTVKVNGSFAYIVSNNKFGFDYLVELLENLDENKEEN